MFFDSHAHLTSRMVIKDLEEILSRAQEAGVDAVANICTNKETLEEGLILAKKYPWIFTVAATTPHDVEKEGEEVFPVMEQAARSGLLVAVGETGLDYFHKHSAKEIQKTFFRRYLQLALETCLPVVIHCRDAFDDFFSIIDSDYVENNKIAKGVLHCFTGRVADAEKLLERDWYISLSGIVTFAKSEELREVAKMVPLERLLIETDTPYLAPQSHRGKRNEPAFLPETAAMIADVKGIAVEDVAKASADNAKDFFHIK